MEIVLCILFGKAKKLQDIFHRIPVRKGDHVPLNDLIEFESFG